MPVHEGLIDIQSYVFKAVEDGHGPVGIDDEFLEFSGPGSGRPEPENSKRNFFFHQCGLTFSDKNIL